MVTIDQVPHGNPVNASNVALERDESLEPEGDAGVEADDQAEVGADMVTEAEGLRLHLSPQSNTGYLRVFRKPNHPSGQPRAKPFQVQYRRDGRHVSLGYFATAVEAAVAYAKHIARGGEAAGEADAAGIVTEAEGLRLHLSPQSSTGYLRVIRRPNHPSGQPRAKPFQVQYRRDGRHVSLGYFATAVEAAVAYARHMARDGESAGEADAAGMVTEAEGLRLHLSPRSSTGYLGVFRLPDYPSGQPPAKPFRAKYKRDGRYVFLGHFATAVEAAVAYARHMARDGEGQLGLTLAGKAEGAGHDDEQEAQSEQGAAMHAADRVPRGIPVHASNVALECDECEDEDSDEDRDECGTFGCTLLDKHAGLHQIPTLVRGLKPVSQAAIAKQRSRSRAAVGDGAWDGACDEVEEGDAAGIFTKAHGLRLHLSPQSNTGYLCVFRRPNYPSGQPPAKPFDAGYKRDGQSVFLGHFATAVEAAVAYARHMARDGEAAAEAEGAGHVDEGDENDEGSDEQDDEGEENDEVGKPDGEVDDEDCEVKLELTPTDDEEEEEEDEEDVKDEEDEEEEEEEEEECREVRTIPAVAQAMESDEDEDEALLEVQVEWEQLRL
eukprot:jgi/Chrpa1/21507/Chrysochromulina_OHIO_Genome00025727-RA